VADAFAQLERENTPERVQALEDALDAIPGGALTRTQYQRLWKMHDDTNRGLNVRRAVARVLGAWENIGPGTIPKDPPPKGPGGVAPDLRGNRHDDDDVFHAVARALADGVNTLGRPKEAGRAALGYGAWRERQSDQSKLPTVRTIRDRFKSRQTKRDRNVWATVIRLGRKAGRIP
jgi:hypothetical protein